MRSLELHGHYGRSVDVDLCAACHLLWFDGVESVNLSGRGVLHLLRAIDAAHGSAHLPLGARLDCPRCGSTLKHAHNLTTLGPTAHHECPRGHGAAQSFSLYLGEKGFVRPLLRPEVEQLRTRPQDRQVFICINCGGPLDPRQRDSCAYCASPVRVLDVLPLMRAVDRQTGQLAEGPATSADAKRRSFACAHCGAAMDPALDRRCPACAMPITITDLKWALAWMEPLVGAIEQGASTREYRERRVDTVWAHTAAQVTRADAPQPRERWRMPVRYEVVTGVMMLIFLFLAWRYSG